MAFEQQDSGGNEGFQEKLVQVNRVAKVVKGGRIFAFTALTVVRQKKDGAFAAVTLDCLGPVTGWQPVGGSGEFEIAYVKLVDHWAGQNGCNTGVRTMDSSAICTACGLRSTCIRTTNHSGRMGE